MSPLATLPVGRDLTEPELAAIVADIAAEPVLWAPQVRADPEQRTYEQLHLDEHLMIWLICWMDGHDTGFHDHDGTAGALTVVSGALREERLRIAAPPISRTLRNGDGIGFSPSTIHRVSHVRGAPAISLHAYSPPLRAMGSYAFEEMGELRRVALAENQELRPLATDIPEIGRLT